MPLTTRRQALVSISAGISAGSLRAQQAYEPSAFTPTEFETVRALADLILPPSDTPGASDAGVPAILDEDLAAGSAQVKRLRDGLAGLLEAGFADMSSEERAGLLARYSESDGPDREFFDTLKGLVVDAYYSTEAGLVDELGYQGNTYLAEFPGCRHEHSLEDAG